MNELSIVAGVVVVGAWLALIIVTIRQISREVETPPARTAWIVLMLVAPFAGPLIWALFRMFGGSRGPSRERLANPPLR